MRTHLDSLSCFNFHLQNLFKPEPNRFIWSGQVTRSCPMSPPCCLTTPLTSSRLVPLCGWNKTYVFIPYIKRFSLLQWIYPFWVISLFYTTEFQFSLTTMQMVDVSMQQNILLRLYWAYWLRCLKLLFVLIWIDIVTLVDWEETAHREWYLCCCISGWSQVLGISDEKRNGLSWSDSHLSFCYRFQSSCKTC